MSQHTDERSTARAREQSMGFVSRPRFEDYREKYAKYFKMERRNGILQVQMHSDGGSVIYGLPINNAWSQLWMEIGNDPDNEVLIFGGAASNAAVVGPVPFGTPFTILCALTLMSMVIGPFAAAAALRHGLE